MITSSSSDLMTAPNAAPMTTAAASSRMLPFIRNALKSFHIAASLCSHETFVGNPVRLVRVDALATLEVFLVRLVVALVPHHLAIALEREDVRRDAIEE